MIKQPLLKAMAIIGRARGRSSCENVILGLIGFGSYIQVALQLPLLLKRRGTVLGVQVRCLVYKWLWHKQPPGANLRDALPVSQVSTLAWSSPSHLWQTNSRLIIRIMEINLIHLFCGINNSSSICCLDGCEMMKAAVRSLPSQQEGCGFQSGCTLGWPTWACDGVVSWLGCFPQQLTVAGRMDGQISGWMDEWVDGQMDEWMGV